MEVKTSRHLTNAAVTKTGKLIASLPVFCAFGHQIDIKFSYESTKSLETQGFSAIIHYLLEN